MLPSLQEAAELVPRRGGPVWRLAGDVRMLNTAGYALILQVAHPTVGTGVAQYSGFLEHPWGRLLRTLDYVHGSIYGGPEMAWRIGQRVRGIHKHIKGVAADGSRYHALEPGAYAWVHATLASAFVDGARVFGTPLAPAEAEDFWREWVALGRLIGVRERDLPATWAEFGPYFDRMVAEELENTETAHLVLDSLGSSPPPFDAMPDALWRGIQRPAAGQTRLTTLGMLGPRGRALLGVPWSGSQEAAFRALARVSRASAPLIRGPLAEFGLRYVDWRAKELARGDVAARVPERKPEYAEA